MFEDTFFTDLCEKAGYEQVATENGRVRVVATRIPAPYIEGERDHVVQRLIRLARKAAFN